MAIVSPTTTTNFTITGTDAVGCVGTIINTVTVNSTLTLTVNSGAICSGSSFTITPGGASTYTYSSGVAIVSPTTTTNYTVTGTDAVGCIGIVINTVTVNTIPTLTVNSGTICRGSSFTITPSGASTYTYSSGVSIVSPTTTINYTVTGVDAVGCVGTIINTVTVNTIPTLTVNSGTICSGSSFTITPSGASTYTYSSGVAIVNPTTTTNYTITGTDAVGCIGVAINTVIVNATPNLTVNSGTICSGSSFTIIPIGASTFTYNSGTNIVNPTTTTNYTVTGTDAVGCVGIVINTVAVNTNPTLTVNSGTICSGSSFTITPSGASTYTYSSGLAIVSPTSTTNYTITGTDATGCIGTSINTVSAFPKPIVVTTPAIQCGASSVILSANSSPDVTYLWNGPNVISGGTTSNPTIDQAGIYTVVVTSTLTGCSSSSTLSINQVSITAAFTADPITGVAPLSVNFTDHSTGASTFNWVFGNGSFSTNQNPNTTYNANGIYTVMLIASSTLCSASASITIIVQDGLSLEIPNVFTPNGDGSNDFFSIKSTGIKEISLQIFNRWGDKLYEYTGTKVAWDGINITGAKVADGTYFYFVKAKGFDDKIIEKHGTLNLFR